jgi:hypothetical protein
VGGVCWEVDFILLTGVVKLLMLLCPRLFCSFLIDASLSLALIDPDLPFDEEMPQREEFSHDIRDVHEENKDREQLQSEEQNETIEIETFTSSITRFPIRSISMFSAKVNNNLFASGK